MDGFALNTITGSDLAHVGWYLLAGLIAVLALRGTRRRSGAMRSRRSRGLRCRWTRGADRPGELMEWTCKTCGMTAYSATGKPPVDCKARFRPGAL